MTDDAANIVIYVFLGFTVLATLAHIVSPRKGGGGSDRGGFDGM